MRVVAIILCGSGVAEWVLGYSRVLEHNVVAGGTMLVGSLSKLNGYSLATTVSILSMVNVRTYPVPATILADRAKFRDFCYGSYASGLSCCADR